MKLTIVGGGGFRVPSVFGRLLRDDAPAVTEVVLYDVDIDRLATIDRVLHQLADGRPAPCVRTTTDADDALTDADVVFSAIRVGGLSGRVADERVALDAGVLGQETVGAGGLAFGLRTAPVATCLAERVAARAPAARVVNFTNPAGLVTEAMQRVLGDRVVGICDSPAALGRRVARALGVHPSAVALDYVGLNHLGWLRRALVGGRDRLPDLLADDAALSSLEEGRLFGPGRLRELGAIPNEYVYYYEAGQQAVEAIRAAGATRGEFLLAQQRRFYAAAAAEPGSALALWRATLREREETYLADERAAAGATDRDQADLDGEGYEGVALSLMTALTGGRTTVLVLDVRNTTAVAGLDADAVVEVPCVVDSNGARPLAVGAVEPAQWALIAAVKSAERLVLRATESGSRGTAVRALAAHPLVASTDTAARLLDGYLAAHPGLADVLPHP